jgi:alkylhydroperoxidase family enzyme
MGEAMLEAIDKGKLETLPPAYLAAVRVIEDIKQDSGASAASFSEAQKHFSPEDLVEICLVAGYYIMTAGFLGSFAIEIEDSPPLGASMKATPSG